MVWVVLIVLIILIVLIVFGYNQLIKLRNMVKDQWSQIDVLLKRRCDLIPNLVETVKGYAKHEKDTLEAVINARNKSVTANSINDSTIANSELTGALNKLFALSEAYPDLKANSNFIDLQKNIKNGENKQPLFGAYIIISPSMVPTINVEDAIIIQRKEADELKVGDIITFTSSDPRYSGLTITHRIVGIEKSKKEDIYFINSGVLRKAI